MESSLKNVLGTTLIACCHKPKTGFYRDGFCKTGVEDVGTHVVCAIMSKEFLEYTKSMGNDLSTPIPQWNFPGLQEGDKWCLCISRWLQAEKVGKAPKVLLEATHIKALKFTSLEILSAYAVESQ
ncbi:MULTISPECIES: DUF2237 family protein [Maribacter]|uniref:DUF2237 domain-containing protein n=2 Tax=Maribacter TaxID=252356 RepID=A0A5B2TYJ2_9FLAO|nr:MULTISPECIES: DUF2237 domain-containing protein [Maribacter]KAA2219362.1 DUF2237 family protein [Maribacter flavus]MDC6404293.1 DUF2237 domain-containing protein [Maribacter sp. PR66]MEE1971435.1 DUF2237 domain-containing protein [Maribacter flavus]TLF46587.1 DUF2237 domain-containing protein [Maribacter aurantiacus]